MKYTLRAIRADMETRSPEQVAFDSWYVANTFDLKKAPIGCRDYCLQWQAWQARAERADDPNP